MRGFIHFYDTVALFRAFRVFVEGFIIPPQ